MLAPSAGWAHCDTMNVPVIPEARKNKDKSVEAGREFVEAYVIYTHYVEGIHIAIMSAGGHGHAEAPTAGHAADAESRPTPIERSELTWRGIRPGGSRTRSCPVFP